MTCNDLSCRAGVEREQSAYYLTVAWAGFVLELGARRPEFRFAMER